MQDFVKEKLCHPNIWFEKERPSWSTLTAGHRQGLVLSDW